MRLLKSASFFLLSPRGSLYESVAKYCSDMFTKLSFLRPFAPLLLLLAAPWACAPEGFSTNPEGLHYKLLHHNPQAPKPQMGDVLDLSVRYYVADSLHMDNRILLSLDSPRHPDGSIETGLSMLHVGDSAVFLLDAKPFFEHSLRREYPAQLHPKAELRFETKLHAFKTKADIERERAAMANRNKMEEEKEITAYLEQNNWSAKNLNGLYINQLKTGTGASLQPGQRVTVHYRGQFLSGQTFDSSYQRNEPFSFSFGTGEVISGWDMGLKEGRVGDRLQLLCPSWYAYAEDGVEGIIPPSTPLLFEIEILAVE